MPVANTVSSEPPFPQSFQALYVHIPYCVRRCGYCGFYSQACNHGDEAVAKYVDSVAESIAKVGDSGLLAAVETAYIGGGTPTMAGHRLCDLVRMIRQTCPCVSELTVEANPDSLTSGLSRALADAGVTRVSLGVQSLSDPELGRLGRVHSSSEALRAAGSVVDAGLDLSCDLMCGIPGQTPDSWSDSLKGVVGVGACHVSCYPLSIEEGTPFDREILAGTLAVPDPDLQADMMLAARDLLGANGFHRYEVASYARDGHECRHNIAYWTGRTYLGLGAGAASMLTPELLDALGKVVDLSSLAAMDVGGPFHLPPQVARIRMGISEDASGFVEDEGNRRLSCQAEGLSSREAAAEDLMLAMRMARGVGPDEISAFVSRGIPADELAMAVDKAMNAGLVMSDPDGRIVPTQTGWLLGNELFGIMWDTAGRT